jgi:hypothetical protein
MSYGFEAMDAAGRVLLSHRVGGYGYKGTFAASLYSDFLAYTACGERSNSFYWMQGRGNYRAFLPKSQFPSPPLVFFELPTYPDGCGVAGIFEESSQWVVSFLSTVQPVVHAFGVFTNEPKSTVGAGIQVFDSNGLLTFDSIARRPLQLLQPPLAIAQPAISWPLVGTITYGRATVTNDTTWTPAVTLPSTVLCSGVALWEALYEPDTMGAGGKTNYGLHVQTWWRLLGRDGNNIRFFGYQYRNCQNATGWLNPYTHPRAFNGHLMLADKALYI